MNQRLSPCVLLALAPFWGAMAQVEPQRIVVATVDSLEITEADLKVEPQLLPLQKQEYEIRLRAVENAVALKLLEQAATKKNLSLDAFFKQEVDSKIPEPTTAELEGFYWGQKDKFHAPFDKVRDQVAQALKRTKIQEGRQALLQMLREQADVRLLLESPRLTVDVGDAPRRGSPSAPVTIVEYSDYQCPYCKQEEPVIKQLSAKYGAKLSLVYKDYPLYDIHPQAQAAAEAAHCAGEQGKYWDYHDELFAAPVLSREVIQKIAAELQLDAEAFRICADARKYKDRVDASFMEAQQLGAKSTPSFFGNGIPLTGAQPIAAFERVIDSEIEASRLRSK